MVHRESSRSDVVSPRAERSPQSDRIVRRAHRKRGSRVEGGASMVEFAIAASAFFLLLLGIIDFALTIFDVNAAAAGVREGSHAAGAYIGTTTAPTSCPGLTNPTFAAHTHTGADEEDDNEALRIICRTKLRMITTGGHRSRVQIRFEDPDGLPSDGVVTDPADNRYIVVCAQVQAQSITGAFTPLMDKITFITRSREQLEFTNIVDGDFHIPAGGEPFFDTTKTC
jgi:hypothetical protein